MTRAIYFDHDGALDDLLSLTLLTRYSGIALKGVTVTPADCLVEPAVSATRKILDLAGAHHVPVAEGTLAGPNPFPLEWRVDALRADALPVLNQREPRTRVSELPAHEQLAQWLLAAPEPVTLLMIGPLTNLAWCLDEHPPVESKIAELVFMGGAIDVAGNVAEPDHDGTAEWNVYWDPRAAHRVFASDIPITLFPLDATDQVPITTEFVRSFGSHYGTPLTDLAGSLLAMTFGGFETTGFAYCCWDSLTTSYLVEPDLCEFEDVRCEVLTTGVSQGRTVRSETGRMVKCAKKVDVARFYRHCLETLTGMPEPSTQ
ncbi:nucleoside hydrolase [Allokutzneria albata]|uniref:Purine nucleosidase n=1 Tax=Allokutzneria albata TaxID=211114 RepID=A0A1G9W5N3_ALLAB|nr:nucleoside hydrolase [Allokutzneria albata]SDM79799.1 purine nucleosidase [Allokutzneria albata]